MFFSLNVPFVIKMFINNNKSNYFLLDTEIKIWFILIYLYLLILQETDTNLLLYYVFHVNVIWKWFKNELKSFLPLF